MVRAQLFCLFALLANSGAFAAERSNIVHILIDALSWQDVACYYRDCHKDEPFYETPHLDRLKDAFTDPRFLCWTTTDPTTAWPIFPPAGVERATQENGNVLVGVYRDVGAGPSAGDLMRALRHFDGVAARELTAENIRSGGLSDLDVLIHPGGSGSKQGEHLRKEGRDRIRQFISDGGGYIGICAGAYLASADYTWSLNVLDAKVLDRKHWARGKGTVEIQLTDAGRRILRSDEQQMEIYYAQGPLLAPCQDPDIPDYETIATYKTEIAENGAPKGIMPGTTAIAKGLYGRGQVICFSPHPEMTVGLQTLVQYAIDHVKRHRTQKARPQL